MTDVPCVGAVVFDRDGRLLLVRRANPPAQGTWSIPGGRVEAGETDEQAVLRELAEETGLTGIVGRLAGVVTRDGLGGDTYVIRDFVVQVTGDAEPRAGDDAADVAWFTRADLAAAETSPGLVDALTEWKALPR